MPNPAACTARGLCLTNMDSPTSMVRGRIGAAKWVPRSRLRKNIAQECVGKLPIIRMEERDERNDERSGGGGGGSEPGSRSWYCAGTGRSGRDRIRRGTKHTWGRAAVRWRSGHHRRYG